MSNAKSWIRIEIVRPFDLEVGEQMIDSLLSSEQMADLLEKVCELSGGNDKGYVAELRGDLEDDPVTRGSQAYRHGVMQKYMRRVHARFRDDWKAKADLSTAKLYLEYNPEQWFQNDSSWLAYSSGRLFTLAYTGVLKAEGFKVSGSNLPPEVCSE